MGGAYRAQMHVYTGPNGGGIQAQIGGAYTLARQKSRPKRKKREQRVYTLLTLLPPITSSIIIYIPLGLISANRTPKKEFTLSEKAIVYKVSYLREKTASIASSENLKKSIIRGIIKYYFI